MPPKPRITAEMIRNQAFELTRTVGLEALNVRALSAKLKCSTQPIMYHFDSMEQLKNEVYQMAQVYHQQYLMQDLDKVEDPLTEIGLRYIRFGEEEKHLFRFLFQTNKFSNNYGDLLAGEELTPIYGLMQAEEGFDPQQCQELFGIIFLTAHGYASLLANNSMAYNEEQCTNSLKAVYYGVVGLMKGAAQ